MNRAVDVRLHAAPTRRVCSVHRIRRPMSPIALNCPTLGVFPACNRSEASPASVLSLTGQGDFNYHGWRTESRTRAPSSGRSSVLAVGGTSLSGAVADRDRESTERGLFPIGRRDRMSQSGSSQIRFDSSAAPQPAAGGSSVARPKSEIPPDDRTIISDRSPAAQSQPPAAFELGKLLAGDRLGHFELLDYVGGGGIGTVFRAGTRCSIVRWP